MQYSLYGTTSEIQLLLYAYSLCVLYVYVAVNEAEEGKSWGK